MLDARTIRRINEQILDEMRIVDSHINSHEEKMEAIERANALKKLLSEDRHEPKSESTEQPRQFVFMPFGRHR